MNKINLDREAFTKWLKAQAIAGIVFSPDNNGIWLCKGHWSCRCPVACYVTRLAGRECFVEGRQYGIPGTLGETLPSWAEQLVAKVDKFIRDNRSGYNISAKNVLMLLGGVPQVTKELSDE